MLWGSSRGRMRQLIALGDQKLELNPNAHCTEDLPPNAQYCALGGQKQQQSQHRVIHMDFLGRGTPPKTSLTFSKFVVRKTGTALLINCLTVWVATNELLSWVSPWHFALSKMELQEAAGTAGEPKCVMDDTVVFSVESCLKLWTLLHSAHRRAKACRLRLTIFFPTKRRNLCYITLSLGRFLS